MAEGVHVGGYQGRRVGSAWRQWWGLTTQVLVIPTVVLVGLGSSFFHLHTRYVRTHSPHTLSPIPPTHSHPPVPPHVEVE